MQFKRPNIAWSIGRRLSRRPGLPALVDVYGAVAGRNRIDRRAAGEQGMGPGIAAVVEQGTEHWIARVGRTTTVVFYQVMNIGPDDAIPVDNAIPTAFWMVGDYSD